MAKHVFIIHRWDGTPESDWYPWLKRELEQEGLNVKIPAMPDTDKPKIEKWVHFLEEQAGEINQNTFFVGHSIGCQAILRLIQKLPDDEKIGGAVLVAGWTNLNEETLEDESTRRIAMPWIETPILWKKILMHAKKFTAIFSDNDPYVPMTESGIFKEKLGANIIIENKKGHMTEEDGITELPSILESVLKMV
ncbi:MAG: serine hydrolase family protein [Candidatus Aenigmarchaeota archaeon]|nr:serine hydrolase family protein [Candidatus Aenigmarchaeota archaeon]